jgi:transposase
VSLLKPQWDKPLTTQFIIVDRDTPYLFQPNVQDYLPENHLARFVVDIAEQLDFRHLSSVYSEKGLRVNGSLKLTHFTAKNDKVKLSHPKRFWFI